MAVKIEGTNIDLTQAIKDYVNEKIGKLLNHYEHIIKSHDIKVKLHVERNRRISQNNIAEVTIFVNGKIVRSEHASEDMYASIDLVSNKIERQLHKYKDKLYRSQQHKDRPELTIESISAVSQSNHKSIIPKIIKAKKFKLNPLTPEDAAEELDLISHDFYVFVNAKTKQINTIYRRKDGDYGLIEPTL